MNKEYLRNFINDHCIFRLPPGYYIQGAKKDTFYTWQFYLRRAIFNQHCMFEVAKWLYENHEESQQYAAMETAGPPMLTALKMYGHFNSTLIRGFGIRKDQKKYGLLNWTEGILEKGYPVVILDDLANSKSTIVRAASISKSHGFDVAGAKTIVNKKTVDNVDGIPVKSIFNVNDFEMTWEEYFQDRQEPPIGEFVDFYKNVLYKKNKHGVFTKV